MNDTSKGARTPKVTTAKKATEAKKNPTKVGMTCQIHCAIPVNFPFDRQTYIIPFLKFDLQN